MAWGRQLGDVRAVSKELLGGRGVALARRGLRATNVRERTYVYSKKRFSRSCVFPGESRARGYIASRVYPWDPLMKSNDLGVPVLVTLLLYTAAFTPPAAIVGPCTLERQHQHGGVTSAGSVQVGGGSWEVRPPYFGRSIKPTGTPRKAGQCVDYLLAHHRLHVV